MKRKFMVLVIAAFVAGAGLAFGDTVLQIERVDSKINSSFKERIYIDGNNKLTLANGKSGTVTVPNGTHKIYAELYTMKTDELSFDARGGTLIIKINANTLKDFSIVFADTGMEGSLVRGAQHIMDDLPPGSQIAIVYVTASDPEVAEFIVNELEFIMMEDQQFKMVDRRDLDHIRKEQRFGLSGEVDDAQAISVGKMLGANIIIIGAEIADTWRDGNTYYAVAVMEKSKCAVIYKNMLDANIALIDRMLKSVDAASFETITQYRLAASIADANSVFAVVLQLLGGANLAGSLKTGDDYRYEAEKAAGLIPVNVTVSGDSNNRIKGAFANVLKEQGFRTGNNNSRYTLVVTLTLSPQDFAGGNFIFTRFVLEANLTDKTNGAVLFPFTKTDRSGHSTQQQADERAIQDAVKLIQSDYGNALAEYLR